MAKISGFVEISFKEEKKYIYQTIRIIANQRKHLHYFMRDKYVLGRRIDDFIATLYIGDGENIVFLESQKHINIYLIKYEIKNKLNQKYVSKKYFIEGDIPPHDSCEFCSHAKPLEKSNKIRCQYYQKILNCKAFCRDFFE